MTMVTCPTFRYHPAVVAQKAAIVGCCPAAEAGFTHAALVQVGAEQQGQFIAWAEDELLPALREDG